MLGSVTAARCRAFFARYLLLHLHAGRCHTYNQAAVQTNLDDVRCPVVCMLRVTYEHAGLLGYGAG